MEVQYFARTTSKKVVKNTLPRIIMKWNEVKCCASVGQCALSLSLSILHSSHSSSDQQSLLLSTQSFQSYSLPFSLPHPHNGRQQRRWSSKAVIVHRSHTISRGACKLVQTLKVKRKKKKRFRGHKRTFW